MVQARKINLLAPKKQLRLFPKYKFYSRIVSYSASEASFSETRGQESREKQLKRPTFSVQRACHSEQHGPDKHQTSRRLHLLRPGVSSPYPRWGDASYHPQYGTVLSALPGDSGYDFPSVVYFPISVTPSMEFRVPSAMSPRSAQEPSALP